MIIIDQTELATYRGEALVCVVLTKQNAIFRTRGKHPVGILNALGYQVVDQHTDVGLGAGENQRLFLGKRQMRVDACHQSLTSGLLVSCGTINLTGEIEIANHS